MNFSSDTEYRFCTFGVREHDYGIDILVVREINRDTSVTRTPGAPAYVRGLLNLRGQVVTILDTSVILGGRPCDPEDSSRLVILRNNAELDAKGLDGVRTCPDVVGLWVDRVSDVVNACGDQIQPPPATRSSDRHSSHVLGIIQREGTLVRVLDPDALLNMEAATR